MSPIILYKELEKCVVSLEEQVQKSLTKVAETDKFDEHVIALESTKDQHYTEILSRLKQIKEHIKVIGDHTKSLQILENSTSKIDKNYIKRQVETFQKIGAVNRRLHKPIRPRETSSLKFLECWEKILDEQTNEEILFPVRKRANSLRKSKKVISSTVETFLENSTRKCASLESLLDGRRIPEAVNESLEEENLVDFKPRIVDVIYKKNVNCHV